MATINTNYNLLSAGYLFPEIARRCNVWQEHNKTETLLRLGIGNTTEALPLYLVDAMKKKLDLLANRETYSGYGDEQGDTALRKALKDMYQREYGVSLEMTEFFVSDGAKSDAANLQSLFGQDNIVAVADPAYPVYVDSNVVGGRSHGFIENKGGYSDFVYLPCTAQTGFLPSLPSTHVDLIYLCSPNNPTGAVMNREQLQAFVDYAIKEKAVIIFDSAYCQYISEEGIPHSIFEIDGAKKCSIEINSFSKNAGFTGVRLGWSIVPKELVVSNSKEGQINAMWNRRQCTFFNGASNIAQAGGIAALSPEGQKECDVLVQYYMDNARMIREGLESVGLKCFGGINSPYIWAQTPNNMSSWEFFDYLLDVCHVVVTPGSGFGPSGEHYIRVSSYGHKENVMRAIASIKEHMK